MPEVDTPSARRVGEGETKARDELDRQAGADGRGGTPAIRAQLGSPTVFCDRHAGLAIVVYCSSGYLPGRREGINERWGGRCDDSCNGGKVPEKVFH